MWHGGFCEVVPAGFSPNENVAFRVVGGHDFNLLKAPTKTPKYARLPGQSATLPAQAACKSSIARDPLLAKDFLGGNLGDFHRFQTFETLSI